MQEPRPARPDPPHQAVRQPDARAGQISPDGRWLQLARAQGRRAQYLGRAGGRHGRAARVITDDRKRGIRFHGWAPDSSHVLYMQDEGGTEEWHIYAVEIAGGAARDLTPLAGVTAHIHDLSLDQPGVAAVAINDRDKAWHDIYRVDIRTGERELLFENRDEFSSIVLDRQLRPGWPPRRAPEGGSSVFRIDGGKPELMRQVVEHEDDLTTNFLGFTRDGSTLYLPLLHRPRQGGAVRHGLAVRQGARAGGAPQGRHLQIATKSADRASWKRPAPNT